MSSELSLADGRVAALAQLKAILEGLRGRGDAPRPEGALAPEPLPDGPLSGAVPDEAGVVFTGWPVLTGWPGVDALGGLSRGVIHEWFGVGELATGSESAIASARSATAPPLRLLAWIAERACAAEGREARRWVCWIGASVWPYPRSLIPDPLGDASEMLPSPESSARGASPLLESSLFVDPPDEGARLWAIDLAVRCPALAAVVADGRGLGMAASRRLQLAVERGLDDTSGPGRGRGRGPLVLLARPPAERTVPSVAGTRWLVERAAGLVPRWSVELLRWKAARALGPLRARLGSSSEIGRRWTLEWRHAESAVVESSVVVDRSGEEALRAARDVAS